MLPEAEINSVAEQYLFENGKPMNVGKHIVSYKLGVEYVSGGAGCISTVDDYIKFLEGLRTNKLLKLETLNLMIADRLSEYQKHTYWMRDTHGYGLGVRCPKKNGKFMDFGWGGAASAFLAVDTKNEISIFFGCHLLSSPAQGLRSMLYKFIMADFFYNDEFAEIQKELKELHNYNLTY